MYANMTHARCMHVRKHGAQVLLVVVVTAPITLDRAQLNVNVLQPQLGECREELVDALKVVKALGPVHTHTRAGARRSSSCCSGSAAPGCDCSRGAGCLD